MADLVTSLLSQYGLGELEPLIEQWIRDGRTLDEFELGLYDRTTEQGKVVDRLYPEMRQRTEQGRAPMSIGQIRDFRDSARALFRSAGLPEGFYDEPEDFAAFIVGDVSVSELGQRIQDGYVAVASAPPEVRQQMRDLYGVDEGGLVAYFLDPNRAQPLLERQVAAARIGGAAVRTGYGALSLEQAERLAGLGVNEGEAQQGLGQLAGAQELFLTLPGEGGTGISTDEQLDATFGGNAMAARRIARKQRQRQTPFEQGGGFTSSSEGFEGIGTAR
jgi:hypothetical protein